MAAPPRILIPGGYGVFGRLLARELLATTEARLVIAGRNARAAREACRELNGAGRCEPLELDLCDMGSVGEAAGGCFAVVCAAGPFQALPRGLPRAIVRAPAHWLDIADDAGWVLPLLGDEGLGETARDAGVVVIPGLSSVPALSGALARWCVTRLPAAVRARIVLWIGNRNAKGPASIQSALQSGFGDPVRVRLPEGECRAYRFSSPDAELLRRELNLDAEFRVAFEWRLSNWLVARLQGAGTDRRPSRLSRALARLAAPLARFGSRDAYLQVEAFSSDGSGLAAHLHGQGQWLAVLPAAFALEALFSGELTKRGCVSPSTLLEPEEWIAQLAARGIDFGSR